jgi:type II secretory pathway component PulJ
MNGWAFGPNDFPCFCAEQNRPADFAEQGCKFHQFLAGHTPCAVRVLRHTECAGYIGIDRVLPARPRSRAATSGFTLLEVLLAAAISVVLMVGLWSLFHIYERLFTKGQARIEQAQLARGLVQQLADDLRSAISDAPPSGALGSSSVRRFGLLGTSRAIQIDVLQMPVAALATDSADPLPSGRSRGPVPQAPELRTVRYVFEEPDDSRGGRSSLSDGRSVPSDGRSSLNGSRSTPINGRSTLSSGRSTLNGGLVRRELDWETPAGRAADPTAARRAGQRTKAPATVSSPAAKGPTDVAFAGTAEDDSTMRASEVTAMELRYFDGRGWSSEWSSLARKSLPVAVEITLRVRLTDDASPSPDDVAANRGIANKDAADRNAADRVTANKFVANRDAANRSAANVAGQGDRAAMTAAGRTYRLLVYLPTTALPHSVERNRPGPKPIVVQRRADPPIFAPPADHAGSSTTFADQWMRSTP